MAGDGGALDRALRRHVERWGEVGLAARAPGRVNLIGDHTDHCEGFALPMALPLDTAVALTSTGDPASGAVVVEAAGFGVVELRPGREVPGWALHLAGVVDLLEAEGVASRGWVGCVDTDVPVGAGLSSSAALEVALTTALLARAGVAWPARRVAELGRRVEHEAVGVPCGIRDQLVSAGATEGCASLLDARSGELSPVPLPPGVVVAVLDTATRRELADGAYAERRASCERAAAALGLGALRDATVADVDRLDDPTDRRRARHVVTEDDRVLAVVAALGAGDVERAGALMSESHASLRDDFEVSGPGLDRIVEVAEGAPGCLGARMTGGGFAGCAVALVREGSGEAFVADVVERYDLGGRRAVVRLCPPSAGASVVSRRPPAR